MDVDPLSDTVPPRYAVESDEEDEYNPLTSIPERVQGIGNIEIVGDIVKGKPLIVVSGQIVVFWATGAKLGEQIGAVLLDKIQVGMLFRPSWTSAFVLVSEATTRLPYHMMHPYASAVLVSMKPSVVSLLDVYPHHAYITADPLPFHQAPVRYLSTRQNFLPTDVKLKRFDTPNLITTTSAAFMSILNSPSFTTMATLFLLPFPRIPAPPPKNLEHSDVSLLDNGPTWPQEMMDHSMNLPLAAIQEPPNVRWEAVNEGIPTLKSPKKSTIIGEGSMYI